jgi:flagellar motor protein MotB
MRAVQLADQTQKMQHQERELAKQTLKVQQQERELEETGRLLAGYKGKLTENNEVRGAFLSSIASELRSNYNIAVVVDPVSGIVRLPEEAVTFRLGSAQLDEANAEKIRKLGAVLERTLPCFEMGRPDKPVCKKINPYGHTLDAVFIEGHTDNMPFKDDLSMSGAKNRQLSTNRSNSVYDIMVNGNPVLKNLTNPKGERLFSISGYGQERPLPGHNHETPTDDRANRRIELRFILTAPDFDESQMRTIESVTKASPV